MLLPDERVTHQPPPRLAWTGLSLGTQWVSQTGQGVGDSRPHMDPRGEGGVGKGSSLGQVVDKEKGSEG